MIDSILIGPSRSIKSPDAIPATAHDVIYVLDPGQYPVSIRSGTWNNVTIESADPLHPATLTNHDNREYGLFQNWGSNLSLVNLDFQFSGPRGVVAQTHGGGGLTLDTIVINQGCLYWGDGGSTVSLKSCTSNGQPWKYLVCNFNHTLSSLSFDNSALPAVARTLHQGPDEALIRFLQITSGYLKGINTTWQTKQEIQIRSGGKFMLEDVECKQVAVGWIEDSTIPAPAVPIQLIQFSGGMMQAWPDVSATQAPSKVSFNNVLIGGKLISK